MAGLLFAQLVNTRINSPADTNLISVPAGHSYILKNATASFIEGGAGGGDNSFFFELSDTAGANFRRISETFKIPAANATYFVNLSPPTTGPALSSALQAVTNVTAQQMSLFNLVLKAGQILRCTSAGSMDSATLDIVINGVDDTE